MINGRNSAKQPDKTYIGVVGSRTFTDKKLFFEAVKQFLPLSMEDKIDDIVVVSGGAAGADTLAEQFATCFYTDEPWVFQPEQSIIDSNGFAAAVHARNQEIVDASDYIIAFLSPGSRGTRSTIDKAIKARKLVIIIPVQ